MINNRIKGFIRHKSHGGGNDVQQEADGAESAT